MLDVCILKFTPAVRSWNSIHLLSNFIYSFNDLCFECRTFWSAVNFSEKKQIFFTNWIYLQKFHSIWKKGWNHLFVHCHWKICLSDGVNMFFFLLITPKWLKKTKSVNISDRHKIYTIRLRMWRQSNIKWFVQIRMIQLWICRKRPTFIVENTKSIIVYIIIERHSIIDCGCHIVNIHSFRA